MTIDMENLVESIMESLERIPDIPLSDIPGIDLLCDNIEFCTAKQAQSVAHQYGKEGVASELYGTTNWDFDFRRHK